MRYLFILLLFTTISIHAQQIDTATITQASKLTGLNFTTAEKDSMIDGLKENLWLYEKMHQQAIPNNLPYPFTFNPAPPGFTIPVKQAAIDWHIPVNVSVPQNKASLAFYSVLQLASLTKNKKITSVELTQFFLDRLKNGGIRWNV